MCLDGRPVRIPRITTVKNARRIVCGCEKVTRRAGRDGDDDPYSGE